MSWSSDYRCASYNYECIVQDEISAIDIRCHSFITRSTFLLFTLPTVKSFVALVKFMFTVPGVTCLLSEKLCQDPLEKFFGCQRQRGGVNENPTAQEFCTNTQALRVVNSFCQNVSWGNCRGRKVGEIDMEKENMPLPKRRKCCK